MKTITKLLSDASAWKSLSYANTIATFDKGNKMMLYDSAKNFHRDKIEKQ